MAERNNQVFVDSNYFIALFNKDDGLAEKVDSLNVRLDASPHTLVISNLVFLEIVTVTSMRAGRQIARDSGTSLLARPDVRLVHIDESLHNETWEIFQQTDQKNISFVDCSIIATMKAEGISKLLTFDKKYFKYLQKSYRFSFYE
ncbi:MAG: PIN domain-containing protein [bacterium]|nr:PIN domain-containing protein [bacterium]